jgi:phosphatidylinositol alpha-1,6-mannosyltransferase
VTRILVVTNDYPPRPGGIQSFVHEVVRRLPPDDVVVYTSSWHTQPQSAAAVTRFDAEQSHPVIRESTDLLLPTPRRVRRACEIARAERCDAVWFGAAAPLGLMAPSLRGVGVERLVATTHGHEAGWAQLPGIRRVLRRIGEGVDVVTYLGEYTRKKVGGALSPAAAARMARLTPGVDVDTYRPHLAGAAELRERLGLADRPVVVCVSRLVPRKGQDMLIKALPRVRDISGRDVALLIVGHGPYRQQLEAQARALGLSRDVIFTGGVTWDDLPRHFAAGDVFAMPCRTRRGGLDVEGLGIVYLEASATGLPVVAGDSGGAPDAVLPGETGYVVDGRSSEQIATRLAELLTDEPLAKAMGQRGRAWVESRWQWSHQAARLEELLA